MVWYMLAASVWAFDLSSLFLLIFDLSVCPSDAWSWRKQRLLKRTDRRQFILPEVGHLCCDFPEKCVNWGDGRDATRNEEERELRDAGGGLYTLDFDC